MKTQNDSVPTREQIAMIAAATQIQNPADAVRHALAIWQELETGNALEAFKWREFGSIPLPTKFPATLEDFYRQVVKGKTPADKAKSFRDFLKAHIAETIERSRLEKPEADEVERFALFHLQSWHDGGCPGKQQWLVTARDYLAWHGHCVSKTNRENALKRTQKPTSPPVTKKKR
jgi:hypothetical protein